jgi:5-methylthioadenosine/S-adenosylhomocysteine deaminase
LGAAGRGEAVAEQAGPSEIARPNSEAVVVSAGHVLTMGPQGDIADGAVAFNSRSGTILAVGRRESIIGEYPDAEQVGETEGILTPGFVNAHDHLSEGLISGMGESMSLFEWAERLIRPVAARHTRETARIGATLKGAEMLRSGVTCVNDMFVHTNAGSMASLGVVEALEQLGLRGVVSFGAEDIPDVMPEKLVFEEHKELAQRAAATRTVTFRLGIGTILGQTDELLSSSIDWARARGWLIHTHLAEVREEITASQMRFGVNSLAWGASKGLLELDVIFAHCIWLNERDIEKLRVSEATIVHNPVSNMILASGVCPVPRLRAAGIPVALGTDGAASNDSHNMLEVMKSAALMQKLEHLDPLALSARDVLEMATIEGARALRLDDTIGSIERGKRADLVRFSGRTVRMAYVHDPYQSLVFAASPEDIVDVWVDGRRVLADQRLWTVDESEVIRSAREAAADLAQSANLREFSVLAGRPTETSLTSSRERGSVP